MMRILVALSVMISPICVLAQGKSEVYAIVLGVAQDAGYPQANCNKQCCKLAWADYDERKFVSCIAIIDTRNKQRFLFDCTPSFPEQLRLLDNHTTFNSENLLDGIFLTHGHIGHYTGLMHLGREAIGAKNIPVYATARMNRFLTNNGPWDQLIKLKNIELNELSVGREIQLTDLLSVSAFTVPHRDEYTDTVGFRIRAGKTCLIYLPDIDKWSKWDRSIESLIAECDFAFLDGSFFADGELPNRDISQIPHPFIEESIKRFSSLELNVRKRIHFIHLNHTNPAIQFNGDPAKNPAARTIRKAGLNLARQSQIIPLD